MRSTTWRRDISISSLSDTPLTNFGGIIGAHARPNWQERPPSESLTGKQWQ
jgi:hypothetical protein